MNPNNNYPPQSPPPGPYPPYDPEANAAPRPEAPNPSPYQQPTQGQFSPQPGYTRPSVQPHQGSIQPTMSPSLPQAAPPPPSYTPPPRPKRYDTLPLPIRMVEWVKKNWWAPALGLLILVVVAQVIYQVAFATNGLPPGTIVDGQDVGGMERDQAVKALNEAYAKVKTNVYFGSATVPYRTPEARELGISVDNSKRLAEVSYPLWLRLIPTSIWWASSLQTIESPLYNYDTATIDRFVQRQLGADCTIKPQNATVKLDDSQFVPVDSLPGGKCDVIDFKNKVAQTKLKDGRMQVRTDMKEVPAVISNDMAKELAATLNENIKDPVILTANEHTQEVPARTIKGWLTFTAVTPEPLEGEEAVQPPAKLTYTVDPERVRSYLDSTIARKIEKKPGVTKIATTDFTETSRQNGEPGVMINMNQALASIGRVVAGENKQIAITTGPVAATEAFTRTYTPSETGMRALIEQFAHDNKGRIGIYMQEENGKQPLLGGEVNAREAFPAAGIEGLYVAFAAQVGVENGSIQPTDKISASLSVEDCIEEAIKTQDSDCIDALLAKVGTPVVVQRLQGLGLRGTAFSGEVNTTTAFDAYTFMLKMRSKDFPLKKKTVLESPLREMQLRDGMLRQLGNMGGVFVMGGATDTVYSEMAYVSNKGVYQIGILTEGADGAKTIAKLTQAIEKLRAERQVLKTR